MKRRRNLVVEGDTCSLTHLGVGHCTECILSTPRTIPLNVALAPLHYIPVLAWKGMEGEEEEV